MRKSIVLASGIKKRIKLRFYLKCYRCNILEGDKMDRGTIEDVGWTTREDIEKMLFKYSTITQVNFGTPSGSITFELPKSIEVPNNLSLELALSYIILELLGCKRTVEENNND